MEEDLGASAEGDELNFLGSDSWSNRAQQRMKERYCREQSRFLAVLSISQRDFFLWLSYKDNSTLLAPAQDDTEKAGPFNLHDRGTTFHENPRRHYALISPNSTIPSPCDSGALRLVAFVYNPHRADRFPVHEREVSGKAYNSRLMKRLFIYLRPYRVQVMVALIAIALKADAEFRPLSYQGRGRQVSCRP